MSEFAMSPSGSGKHFGVITEGHPPRLALVEFRPSPVPSQQLSLDEALAQVEANANSQWKEAALRIVKELCLTRRTFTTDDIADEMGKTMHHTHDKRVMGTVMRNAMKNGWCFRTQVFVKTQRKAHHASDIPIWESLIYSPNQ